MNITSPSFTCLGRLPRGIGKCPVGTASLRVGQGFDRDRGERLSDLPRNFTNPRSASVKGVGKAISGGGGQTGIGAKIFEGGRSFRRGRRMQDVP